MKTRRRTSSALVLMLALCFSVILRAYSEILGSSRMTSCTALAILKFIIT